MTPLELANVFIGIKEYPVGSNSIIFNDWYYRKHVSGADYPWCMAFIQYIFMKTGYALPILTAGCTTLMDYYKSKIPSRIVQSTDLKPNDIVLYNWGISDSVAQHCGIFYKYDGNSYIYAIEGNTSASSDDNGGAVQMRNRHISNIICALRPYDYYKGDNKMTIEEVRQEIAKTVSKDYIEEIFGVDGKIPEWAESEFKNAIALGITDGNHPDTLIPRYQAAIMAYRAVLAATGGYSHG